MGLNVAALGDFNNEVAGKVLLQTIYKGNTAEYVSIQEGIKYQEPLNKVAVHPYFQGGDAVTTPSGSAVFSQRNITVTKRTAYDSWNLQTLTQKYLGISALPEGSYEETFSLLNDLTTELVAKAQQDNDNFIWNAVGGAEFPGSTVTAEADGFKTLISGSTANVKVATGISATAITASSAYEQLSGMVQAMDPDVADAPDLTFFCGISVFQRIINGLTVQNLFHFDPTTVKSRGGYYEVPLPGYPNVVIVGGWGLRNSERVVLGPASDMYVGCDLISDTSNYQLWYDINSDTIKYRLRNKLGTQIGHPHYWVSNDVA